PFAAASATVRRIVRASPPWKPQAMLMLVIESRIPASSPMVQEPNDSAASLLRSMACMRPWWHAGRTHGDGPACRRRPAPVASRGRVAYPVCDRRYDTAWESRFRGAEGAIPPRESLRPSTAHRAGDSGADRSHRTVGTALQQSGEDEQIRVRPPWMDASTEETHDRWCPDFSPGRSRRAGSRDRDCR